MKFCIPIAVEKQQALRYILKAQDIFKP